MKVEAADLIRVVHNLHTHVEVPNRLPARQAIEHAKSKDRSTCHDLASRLQLPIKQST